MKRPCSHGHAARARCALLPDQDWHGSAHKPLSMLLTRTRPRCPSASMGFHESIRTPRQQGVRA